MFLSRVHVFLHLDCNTQHIDALGFLKQYAPPSFFLPSAVSFHQPFSSTIAFVLVMNLKMSEDFAQVMLQMNSVDENHTIRRLT